eukprot:1792611-Pleurochrysis_carterae.AAC.1
MYSSWSFSTYTGEDHSLFTKSASKQSRERECALDQVSAAFRQQVRRTPARSTRHTCCQASPECIEAISRIESIASIGSRRR